MTSEADEPRGTDQRARVVRRRRTVVGFFFSGFSGAIVDDKVNCIAATKAETTVCNDAGCTMNISGMCHRNGVQTRVTHIAELMAQAMGLDLSAW